MGELLRLPDSLKECNNPIEYDRLEEWQKEKLQDWINDYIRPHVVRKYNSYRSSYGLKHLFEKCGGFYITNGQFKGAMLKAGFQPEEYKSKNWIFKVGRRAGTLKVY